MQSLLQDLIDDFSPTESRVAATWLGCAVHNSKPELSRLFSYLMEQTELGINADASTAYSIALPGQAFSASKWAKLQHELLDKLEHYLAYQQFSCTEEVYRNTLLNVYKNRGLERHLQTRLTRYQKRASNQETAGTEQFWYAYHLERMAYGLSSMNQRTAKNELLQQEDTLLQAVLASKLRQACESLAYLRLFKTDFEIPLLKELLPLAEQFPQPGIRLFYLAVLLYRDDTNNLDEVFSKLKAGIEASIEQFPAVDRRNLLVLAINHCLRQSNAGREAYYRQALDLYQLGIQEKILYERGELGIFTFNNIVAIALRLGETDWAENFLETNARRLPADYRTEVESLNRARLSFHRKDYDATLSYLQTADYRDFIHHMSARVMQLKIFYERDNFNLLTSHIRSSRSLLHRKRNVGYHQRNYLNIFTLTDRLLKLPPSDQEARKKLKAQIMETEPCTEQAWLLEQCK